MIRDVPELVLQFTIYEGLRRVVQRFNGEKKLDTGFHLLLGGTAGALSAVFSTPLDVRFSCFSFCTVSVHPSVYGLHTSALPILDTVQHS